MDQLLPIFNAVEGADFGPNTERPIRYTIADFKRILKRFLDEWIIDGSWVGPVAASFTLWSDDTYTGTNPTAGVALSVPPASFFNFSASGAVSALTGNTFTFPEFEDPINSANCPLVVGSMPPVREDANVIESVSGSLNIQFSLFTPAIVQATWEEATHVWLKMAFTVFPPIEDVGHQYSYTCIGSGAVGGFGGGPSFRGNVLGIDYAAGGGGFPIAPTSSILLGDSTTALFLWSPTGNHFSLDNVETRLGLD